MTLAIADLSAEIHAWKEHARGVISERTSDPPAWLQLVRDGINLRRAADQHAQTAADRRALLSTLAATQQQCARVLNDWLTHHPGQQREPLIAAVLRELQADHDYLAALLTSGAQPTEQTVRSIDAFRVDLSWSARLVALLDGGQGPDALTLVLAEQERLLALLDEAAAGEESTVEMRNSRARAAELRLQTLAGVARALGQPASSDAWTQHHARWQSASRLLGHIPANEQAAAAALLQQALQARAASVQACAAAIGRLDVDSRLIAVRHVAHQLLDHATDAVTFLEDLPLAEEVRSLELLRSDLDAVAEIVRNARRATEHAELQQLSRSLRRRRKIVSNELQDRQLAWRLESRFGRRTVAAWERFVLFTLVLFVCLLAAEGPLIRLESAGVDDPGFRSLVEIVFAWFDLAVCGVFLFDFFIKLAFVEDRPRYFWRNWLTGLLPSLPLGFFAYATHHLAAVDVADRLVLLRFLRYARLPQMARWLRVARPAVRALRLFAFALRAGDRLVRQLTPVLNRNLVLFERASIELEEPAYRQALTALREQFIYRAPAAWAGLDRAARQRVTLARLEDLAAISSALHDESAPAEQVDVATAREIPVESVVARLLTATPAQVIETIGVEVAESVSRWCRALDVAVIRRLPMARSLAEAGRHQDPAEATAHAARYFGSVLKRLMERVHWAADLYGTVTAPQLVDSLGTWLMKGASRPAKRLLLLGTSLLVVSQVALLLPSPTLDEMVRNFKRLVATPLIVLGTVCLAFLGIGVWFRRIASQATEFYEHVAEAQYINALKGLKRRLAERHYALVEQNVLEPERRLLGAAASDARLTRIEADTQAMWHDYLDAAPFHKRDTKTTTQLLGNLVLVSLRETRLNFTSRQKKRLRQLNLEQAYGGLRGPYLWFRFISRSVSQQTAKLVVDYNAHVLPLSRAQTASGTAVERYAEWLRTRLGTTATAAVLPAEFGNRNSKAERLPNRPLSSRAEQRQTLWHFQGNDFTSLHFLSADAALEADIRLRYGDVVADLMRRDRRDNIRRVFRTFPFHHLPKDRRTVNPLILYQQHWAGGRALLLPAKLLWLAAKIGVRLCQKTAAVVGDVLQPTDVEVTGLTETDPFSVAVRKIHRMRKPVFVECMLMRAHFDPEYLGVALPIDNDPPQSLTPPIDHDLACIDAELPVRQEVRSLSADRRRQLAEFLDWRQRLGISHVPHEAARAMWIAYAIDHQRVRRRLEATNLLQVAAAKDVTQPGQASNIRRGIFRRLADLLSASKTRRRIETLLAQPAFADLPVDQRTALRHAIEGQRGELLAAVVTLTKRATVDDPVADAAQRLVAVARDPATWSRQLAVLRAVQTLTVVDLQIYCDLVRQLGEYDAESA